MNARILPLFLLAGALCLAGCGGAPEDAAVSTSAPAVSASAPSSEDHFLDQKDVQKMIDQLPAEDLSEDAYIANAKAFYEEAKAYLEAHPAESYANAMKDFTFSQPGLPMASEVWLAAESVAAEKAGWKKGKKVTPDIKAKARQWVDEHYPNAKRIAQSQTAFSTLEKENDSITFYTDGSYKIDTLTVTHPDAKAPKG